MNALLADHALLPTGWANDVLLRWDDAGSLRQVEPGAQFVRRHRAIEQQRPVMTLDGHAILDRLVHNAHRLTMTGDSMRKISGRRALDATLSD